MGFKKKKKFNCSVWGSQSRSCTVGLNSMCAHSSMRACVCVCLHDSAAALQYWNLYITFRQTLWHTYPDINSVKTLFLDIWHWNALNSGCFGCCNNIICLCFYWGHILINNSDEMSSSHILINIFTFSKDVLC